MAQLEVRPGRGWYLHVRRRGRPDLPREGDRRARPRRRPGCTRRDRASAAVLELARGDGRGGPGPRGPRHDAAAADRHAAGRDRSPRRAVRGATRAEYGWDHSLATLADCLRLAAMFEGPLKAMPVVQGLAVASEDQVRRPLRPQPEPVDPVAASRLAPGRPARLPATGGRGAGRRRRGAVPRVARRRCHA